jgi:hypothetical protein
MIALFGIEINWWHGVRDFITIIVAYMLALPIGWHRLRGGPVCSSSLVILLEVLPLSGFGNFQTRFVQSSV